MSVPNGEKLATKQDLADMYQGILPYLGGSADAGFTPVGSVIAIMGVTAPANYLACDGTVYNISDYPELANYFYQQFGSKNFFGGDGTTTFAVSDLRGEFLRGAGTNSHTGNGNGANVGVHQDATVLPWYRSTSTTVDIMNSATDNVSVSISNHDSTKQAQTDTPQWNRANRDSTAATGLTGDSFTIRPTNTSVLWCIATKNIYLNPAMDYSTEEKIVGTWMGKPLYQKTINCGALPNATLKTTAHGISNMGLVISAQGFSYIPNSVSSQLLIPLTNPLDATNGIGVTADTTNIYIRTGKDRSSFTNTYVTIQYTKTN